MNKNKIKIHLYIPEQKRSIVFLVEGNCFNNNQNKGRCSDQILTDSMKKGRPQFSSTFIFSILFIILFIEGIHLPFVSALVVWVVIFECVESLLVK